MHKLPNKASKNLSTSLSAALYSGDKASVIILTATGVSVVPSRLLALCLRLCVCVNERERERHKVNGEKRERERDTEFGEFWLTGRHMARLVFLSVFCLCLRASCLSQAGRGAAETGSLMRHRGRGRGEERRRSRSDGGRTTGRNSTAANPALFHFIYIISSLPMPIPSLHLTSNLNMLVRKTISRPIIRCTENKFISKPHTVAFSDPEEKQQMPPSHTPKKLLVSTS